MIFINQFKSQATNGWPILGKHLGLLIDDGVQTLSDRLIELRQNWGKVL